jgi:hypothetical protein
LDISAMAMSGAHVALMRIMTLAALIKGLDIS